MWVLPSCLGWQTTEGLSRQWTSDRLGKINADIKLTESIYFILFYFT